MTATVLAYDPNNIKPGWTALVIVILLAIATFLLWRSMNTQLGRIKAPHRADLPRDSDGASSGTTAASSPDAATAGHEPTRDEDMPEDPDASR